MSNTKITEATKKKVLQRQLNFTQSRPSLMGKSNINLSAPELLFFFNFSTPCI